MNEHVKPASTAGAAPATMTKAEWEARVDLAAVYRLCHEYGWGELIYNHCSMRVPGEPHMILMKRHADMWNEVTASNLVKVDIREDLDERAGVNRPGFTLHGGLMAGRPDITCAVHIHGDTGMAIAAVKHGLRMISQQALRFYNRIGYHPYEGITEDFSERARILKALGNNRALIMHNHGLVTVGKSAREAFILMKYLVSAANIQLRLEATGSELIEIPPETCEKVAKQFESHDAGRGGADWPAYMRLLDKIDPSFKY
jgi:ribulose-5-phosphate 4-epimerase/fuculose-1-phosphate aldolase